MRSRPELAVFLSPAKPLPGDTLEVEARLDSKSETPLDRVVFTLTGVETVRVQRGKSTLVQRRRHVGLVAEAPGRPLTPGKHTYRARFDLPATLPPRYLGRHASVDYVLEVRADIPWWPDRRGRFSVPVAPLPVAAAPKPCVFVSAAGGARAGALYAEISLASAVVEPGGELVGTVALTNAADMRRVSIALVAFERLFAEGTFLEGGAIRDRLEAQRWAILLSDGPPEEGASLPFRLPIVPEMVPGYTGAISALEWAVEVTHQRLFSRPTLVSAPLMLVPPTGAAAGRGSPRVAVPAVGHERRVQSFAHVAQRLGIEHDAEHEDLRAVLGSVGLRADVESRPDGSLATVAHLAWPSLGMGLVVTQSSWTDHLSTREIDVGVADFDHRFHVESRFPEQARALLDADLCALLLSFPDVRLGDEGATLAVAVALADEEPLADFVTRAARTAHALDAAFARVPVPPPLAVGAEAWRALAARLGGRFEPGRGAIHDGELGQERVSVTTEWADDGAFLATVVRVPLDVRVDPEALSSGARAQAASLGEQTGGRVAITEEGVTLTLDRVMTDPQVLDAALEGVTHLVHAVRRRGEGGPFRS